MSSQIVALQLLRAAYVFVILAALSLIADAAAIVYRFEFPYAAVVFAIISSALMGAGYAKYAMSVPKEEDSLKLCCYLASALIPISVIVPSVVYLLGMPAGALHVLGFLSIFAIVSYIVATMMIGDREQAPSWLAAPIVVSAGVALLLLLLEPRAHALQYPAYVPIFQWIVHGEIASAIVIIVGSLLALGGIKEMMAKRASK